MNGWLRAGALGLCLTAGSAFAHGPVHKGQQLTGEIVDITCFLDHDSRGAKHAKCARACIKKGMPVGLLVGDQLYAVVLGGHASPNARLAQYAGKTVTITGHTLEKAGLRAIDMERVALAGVDARGGAD